MQPEFKHQVLLWERGVGGGDVDDRSQWVPDWQVDKRKAGWCVGVGVGVVAGERGRERE